MDVEIAVPNVPPTLTPGTRTKVPVELHNASGEAVRVRLSVTQSRVSDWAVVEPATADLPPGGHRSVDVVFQPPAGTTPDASLLPFTVRAVDADSASRLGSATGLVQVSGEAAVEATLTAEVATAAVGRFALWLRNRGTSVVSLTLTGRLEPAGGQVDVEPDTVDIEPGRTATARVTTRPQRRLVGAPTSYSVSVIGHDGSGGAAGRQVVTVRAGAAAPARTGLLAVLAMIALLLFAGFLAVRFGDLRLPFRGATPSPAPGATATGEVRRPYVMVDSYPQLDPSYRTKAETSLSRLAAAGLPVRLIDSMRSDEIADGTNGFWVVLRDGFSSVEEANQFCARYRGVTPRCEVVS
jgi:hypothetical protein